MQREKSVWGEDAHVFRPDRWIEYNEQRKREEKANGDKHLGAERSFSGDHSDVERGLTRFDLPSTEHRFLLMILSSCL